MMTDQHHPQIQYDENGLIVPRKIQNPCLESRDRKDLHRELLWNQRIGKNVLEQKTELERAYEKRKEQQKKSEIEREKVQRRSSFELRLEKQAEKLKEYTIDGTNAKTPNNNQNLNQQNVGDSSHSHIPLHNHNNNQDSEEDSSNNTISSTTDTKTSDDPKMQTHTEFMAARAKFCASPSLSNPSSSPLSSTKRNH